jgi:hypothetical protein
MVTTLPTVHLTPFARSVQHFTLADQRTWFDLDAPYQRESVWSRTQRQGLIKSLLMGLPTGAVTLNFRLGRSAGAYTVVDGKQRIETLRAFYDDEFAVPAAWFTADAVREVIDEYPEKGVLFSGLTPDTQAWFGFLPMPTLEARVDTVQEEAEIYLLINSAGTEHTTEDIEKAVTVRDSAA